MIVSISQPQHFLHTLAFAVKPSSSTHALYAKRSKVDKSQHLSIQQLEHRRANLSKIYKLRIINDMQFENKCCSQKSRDSCVSAPALVALYANWSKVDKSEHLSIHEKEGEEETACQLCS